MIVFDPVAASCQIFEVKHSEEAVRGQYRHLIDGEKCAQTEHRYVWTYYRKNGSLS